MVYETTLSNKYAIGNIILGILGKTDNVPFILAKPLDYADLVVGLDINRKKRETYREQLTWSLCENIQ